MKSERRQHLLKITAAAMAALFVLDRFGIEPAIQRWHAQTTRVAALREKVEQGRQLLGRDASLRERWAAMRRANLPDDLSTAENAVFKAIGRWVRESQINLTNLTPQWQPREDGFDTLECRLAATGNQATLGRFLYELESDASVPVHIEECELSTRNPHGSEINLTTRITFLRLKETSRNSAP